MLMKLMICAAVSFAAGPAMAAEGAWSAGQKASVRLIAAGVGPDGRLSGGIEISLPKGWHTYWRSPGDAGIAPTFDFSGSENLGEVSVSFPLPTRRDDGLSVTNIYSDNVIFPISAPVLDPGEGVELSLKMDFGVCSEICVPDTLTAALGVPAGENDGAVAAVLADVRDRLPDDPLAGFSVEDIVRDGGTDKRPVFRIRARVPDASSADLFVEGPEGWSPYRPERLSAGEVGEAIWSIKFSRLGAPGPVEEPAFRITLVSGGEAIEQVVSAR